MDKIKDLLKQKKTYAVLLSFVGGFVVVSPDMQALVGEVFQAISQALLDTGSVQ